ncbi:glycosyltransferase family 4 protein [Faunimonas sp. B44]|uniref:glycosyltransferase family 4 protein n=1 Tax=Faunimonas sp. B44 TaxID=3461493 RepID=UPI00404516C8
MKRVWMLNHYALEPGGAGGTRHYSLSRHLPAHGWESTVIAASTLHPSGRQRLEPGERWRLERLGGVDFLWLAARSYSGNGPDRVLNMLDYTYQALRSPALKALPRPDVVIGSSVHPLAAWAGSRLAKRYSVPFVFEVRDLWPQTLIDMGRLGERSPMTHLLRRVERALYGAAALVVTPLPRAADYIVPLGVPEEKVVWISNGVELEDPDPPPYPRRDGRPFTLMYFGAHGGANALETVLDAMAIVQRTEGSPAIRLRLIGEGPLKPALVERSAALGLANVVFEAPVPKERVPALAAEADAFVLSTLDLPKLYRFGISMNKLFDYFAAARPVILAAAAANDPVAEAGAGPSVPPQQPERLARAILDLAATPHEERVRMGQAGYRHALEHYAYAALAAKLASRLDGVAGRQALANPAGRA